MKKHNADAANSVRERFFRLNNKTSINRFINCDSISFVEDKHLSSFTQAFFCDHPTNLIAASTLECGRFGVAVAAWRWLGIPYGLAVAFGGRQRLRGLAEFMTTPRILVTNDDGITAPGLEVLVSALEAVGDVWVFAPDRQQSAVGHGVSLHRPLRVTHVKERWVMVDGTPTDCVMLAVRSLMEVKPDLVVSGINPGPNLGDDVTYSGTVAGAYEGMLLGIPSFAVSSLGRDPQHMETAARAAVRVAEEIFEGGLPSDTALNVNVPDVPYEELQGLAITRMGRRDYKDEIVTRTDPRGNTYHWIGGAEPSHVVEPGTDFEAIDRCMVSVTPLHRDVTHHAVIEELKNRGFST